MVLKTELKIRSISFSLFQYVVFILIKLEVIKDSLIMDRLCYLLLHTTNGVARNSQ